MGAGLVNLMAGTALGILKAQTFGRIFRSTEGTQPIVRLMTRVCHSESPRDRVVKGKKDTRGSWRNLWTDFLMLFSSHKEKYQRWLSCFGFFQQQTEVEVCVQYFFRSGEPIRASEFKTCFGGWWHQHRCLACLDVPDSRREAATKPKSHRLCSVGDVSLPHWLVSALGAKFPDASQGPTLHMGPSQVGSLRSAVNSSVGGPWTGRLAKSLTERLRWSHPLSLSWFCGCVCCNAQADAAQSSWVECFRLCFMMRESHGSH